jgi:hypothetical protein
MILKILKNLGEKSLNQVMCSKTQVHLSHEKKKGKTEKKKKLRLRLWNNPCVTRQKKNMKRKKLLVVEFHTRCNIINNAFCIFQGHP